MGKVFDVVVIGAGQAGLAAAWELVRRGFVPGESMVVLDANEGPGGAWRHRWDSLTFDKAHGIADLPGMGLPRPDPTVPSSRIVRGIPAEGGSSALSEGSILLGNWMGGGWLAGPTSPSIHRPNTSPGPSR